MGKFKIKICYRSYRVALLPLLRAAHPVAEADEEHPAAAQMGADRRHRGRIVARTTSGFLPVTAWCRLFFSVCVCGGLAVSCAKAGTTAHRFRLRKMSERFMTLCLDLTTFCGDEHKVGIGVATGADKAFIESFDALDVRIAFTALRSPKRLPQVMTHRALTVR